MSPSSPATDGRFVRFGHALDARACTYEIGGRVKRRPLQRISITIYELTRTRIIIIIIILLLLPLIVM